MNLSEKFTMMFKNTRTMIIKNAPEICTGIGVAGMMTSIFTAVAATPKAVRIIDAKKEELDTDILTTKETVKAVWKEYVPTTILALSSASFIIYGGAINKKRNAALTTAYALSERALLNYRDKVIETLGEKKDKKIRNEISQDKVNNSNKSQVYITEKGNTLFMDSVSGRYFRSNIDKIRKAINELNRKMTYQYYISLNELYDSIDLEPIKTGEDLGWNMDDGLIEISFDTCLAENDEPCIVLDYTVAPRLEFDKLM